MVTGKNPRAMSLTSLRNVLVLIQDTGNVAVLREYGTHGAIVRNCPLPVVRPTYAVALSGDRVGVTYSSEHSMFTIFSRNGTIVSNYGILSGSAPGQLNNPCGIAVNKLGFIFVADSDNNRIVVLNPDASASRVLPLRVPDFNLDRPWYVWLDQTRDRLYIGESRGRLLVVDKMNTLHFD